MLIAEIRGKLSDLEGFDSDHVDARSKLEAFLSSGKEDILTSDLFGVLKYLPRQPYLKTVLQQVAAANPHASEFSASVAGESFGEDDFQFRFWPVYQTKGGIPGDRIEPDVEISSRQIRIFVEAKLHSGFGDLQLVRQLIVGLQHHDRQFYQLLVTAGARPPWMRLDGKMMPIAEYLHRVASRLSIPAIDRKKLVNASCRVLWINWRVLGSLIRSSHDQLSPSERQRCHTDMIVDLETLLRMRGLASWRGFSSGLANCSQKRPVCFHLQHGSLQSFWLRGVVRDRVLLPKTFQSPKRKVGRIGMQWSRWLSSYRPKRHSGWQLRRGDDTRGNDGAWKLRAIRHRRPLPLPPLKWSASKKYEAATHWGGLVDILKFNGGENPLWKFNNTGPVRLQKLVASANLGTNRLFTLEESDGDRRKPDRGRGVPPDKYRHEPCL